MGMEELLNKLVDRYNIVNKEKQSLINYRNELNKRNLKLENNIDEEIVSILEDADKNSDNQNKFLKYNFILTGLIMTALYAKYGMENTRFVVATPFICLGTTLISSAIYNNITKKEYIIDRRPVELIDNNNRIINEVNYKIKECDKILIDIKNTINSLNTNVELSNSNINDYNKTRKLTK